MKSMTFSQGNTITGFTGTGFTVTRRGVAGSGISTTVCGIVRC